LPIESAGEKTVSTPLELLNAWVARVADAAGAAWFADTRSRLAGEHTERDLFVGVGLVARKLGKAPLPLTPEDMAAATAARAGWDPTGLTVDQAARLGLLLTAAAHGEPFHAAFQRLWRTADVGEQVAFYRGLPLYPDPERHLWRATDGCRTAIRVVFEAIAHGNPYPAEHFDETAWNQMCLKALFVGTTLHPVVGLDTRHNRALARMMADYAFERWAASRPVAWELWRCVGPEPDDRALSALARAVASDDPATARAATLAAATSRVPAATELVARASDQVQAELARGALTWSALVTQFPISP
jgi:hypothetical protein